MKQENFIGRRFGMLTVSGDSGQRKGSSVLWNCKCDCGGEILAIRHELLSGRVTDCGCIQKEPRPQVSDLIGQRFGMLTVSGDSGKRSGSGVILWKCKCDCGGEKLATRQQLISGNVVNCGCIPKKQAPKNQAEDLTGRQFGELTAIRRAENDKNGRVCWVCRCSCGKECTVQALKLKSGHTRSCGCRRYKGSGNRRDLTGQRFGRLTALYYVARKDRVKTSYWHCRCDCGKELDVNTMSLLRGATQSCGCWDREQAAKLIDHMHIQDDTCLERLERVRTDSSKNKAGFRGLFITKDGTYRVMISFQKKHYNLGYFKSFNEAVRVRLEAEEVLQVGYINAFNQYAVMAKRNPAWAKENPFFFRVRRVNGYFQVDTNGV